MRQLRPAVALGTFRGWGGIVDAVLSQAVAEAATAGAAKVLGGSIGTLAGRRRARVVRRSVEELAGNRAGAEGGSPSDLSEMYSGQVAQYVHSPSFEQLAIQLTGMVLERKRPEKYVQDLRESLARSLYLQQGIPHDAAEWIAGRLFDELWAAVAQFIGEISNPPGVRELPGLAVSVSVRAAAAARNSQLLKRLETLADFRELVTALRAQVHRVEGQVRPPRAEGGRRVSLSKIYVTTSLAQDTGDQQVSHVETLTAAEALAEYFRLVVLGDPGGGKSTLCAWMAYELAGGRRAEENLFQVPLLVRMREYCQWFEREQMPLARYFEIMIGARYQIQAPVDCIDFLLLNGHAVVILDGLDELLETALRRRISEAVEAFAYAYPATSMLVTSRRIGYMQAPLDQSLFTAFRLNDFGPQQVEDYSRKWFALDSSLPVQQRRELATAFASESRFVEELRRNPLMLALMCALYRGDGYIPRNRLDVYERCAVLLFEGWDRQRGIPVQLPFEQHLRPALCYLALWMYADRGRQSGVTERELITTVARFLLGKRFEDPDEAEAAARTFIAYCQGRAWVLTEAGTTADGEPLFMFAHRTFLEFFAASQLVRTLPTPPELYAHLEPHIRAQEWDAVAELAVLLLDRNVEAGADAFVMLLIRGAESASSREGEIALLSFAGWLVSHLIPSPPVLRELFLHSWRLVCSLDPDEIQDTMIAKGPQMMQPATSLLHAQQENRAPLARMIREHATANPTSGISPLLAVNLDQLVWTANLRQRQVPEAMRAFWYQESTQNADSLLSVFTALAPQHLWAAVEAVLGESWSVERLIRFHGPRSVCEESPVWATYQRAPIVIQEVLACSRFKWTENSEDSRLWPSIWVNPTAGSFAGELARILPLSPAP